MNKYLEEIITPLSKHADSTNEAREFYKKFWGEKVDNYGGETIISFNTMAGCLIRCLPEYFAEGFTMPSNQEQKRRLEIIEKSDHVSIDLKNNFRKFYHLYHSLANFMPLIIDNENSLNSQKNNFYHDFPDSFFADVRKIYITENFSSKWLSKRNEEYFESFGKGDEGWKNFVEQNYLQDFFKDETFSDFIQLNPNNDIMPFRKKAKEWKKKVKENDEDIKRCKDDINKFLVNAISIIELRAKRLENTEKSNLNN